MVTSPACTATIRPAGLGDLAALVDLRDVMLTAMGVDTAGPDAPWRAASEGWLRSRLPEAAAFRAVVADVPGEGVVACAIGVREEFMPSPSSPTGGRGHLFNVATAPQHRRHGHARACVTAVVDWFTTDTDIRVVDLHATPDGTALYRSLGFAPPRFESLQRHA